MSTGAPPVAGPEAFAYFLTDRIPEVTFGLLKLERLARERGLFEIEVGAQKIIDELLKDVNEAAIKMAAVADGTIMAKMFTSHTASRPITGNMETHVRSEPGPLGSVKVALIEELNKIINPEGGFGPFWRAQEYGTGSPEVKTQEGRYFFGRFEPSGDPPRAALRGLGVGTDIAFIPDPENGGIGKISVELPGRHFLRDGSAEAGAIYGKTMDEIRDRFITRVEALVADLKAIKDRGTLTLRVVA